MLSFLKPVPSVCLFVLPAQNNSTSTVILNKSGFAQRFISILKYVLAGAAGGAGVSSKSIHPGRSVFVRVLLRLAARNGLHRTPARSPTRCQMWQKVGAREQPGQGVEPSLEHSSRHDAHQFLSLIFLLVPITTARLAGGERNIKTLIKSSRLSHVWALSLSERYLWLGFKFL